MTERQKETKFIKNLILCEDSDQGRRLQERIKNAEKDEKCIRCAVYLVLVLTLLSVTGLGYSVVLVPSIARFSTHLATRVCCAVGLGSLICLAIFLGYWFWYRAMSNRVYEECRRFLRAALEGRLKQSPVPSASAPATPVDQIETQPSQDRAVLLELSKVS